MVPRPMPGKVTLLFASAGRVGGSVGWCFLRVLGIRGVGRTDFVFLPVVLDGREGTSGRYEGFAVCPAVEVCWVGFVQSGWIAEGEDDGAVDVAGHFFDYLFGEGFGFGGCTDEDVGFDFFDYGEEVAVVFAFPVTVVAGIFDLSGSQFVVLGFEE